MCDECLYYEWEEGQFKDFLAKYSAIFVSAKKLMPEDLPLEDDNSDFTLMGYQNFLIEPKASQYTCFRHNNPSLFNYGTEHLIDLRPVFHYCFI